METTSLRTLTKAKGPFASVYFEDSHNTEDAEKQLELKWRGLHETLAAQGVPAPTLAALEAAVWDGTRPAGTSGRALIAAAGDVMVNERLPEPPVQVVRVSDLPYLLPLAQYAEHGPIHVIAGIDRIGAEIRAVDERGREIETETVRGRGHPVHKVRGGGPAHRDLQSHTEETVRHNISEMAEAIAKLAQRVGAELIVLAGEVQARRAVHDELPGPARRLATETTTTEDPKVGALVAAAKNARIDDVVDRFRAEFGRDTGLAVAGLEAVTTALREGNVDTLLAGDPGAAGVSIDGVERRADEALPFEAIAVGAALVHVGEKLELTEGFGAILRHG